MLFSEPKIPQPASGTPTSFAATRGFSALQRAENSSTVILALVNSNVAEFQCSSASRKFLNSPSPTTNSRPLTSFSALQRAENSSTLETLAACSADSQFQCSSASRKFLKHLGAVYEIDILPVSVLFSEPKIPQTHASRVRPAPYSFQCSSASRKFLNYLTTDGVAGASYGFSALQRAENSSTRWTQWKRWLEGEFQCSSASRKFLNVCDSRAR